METNGYRSARRVSAIFAIFILTIIFNAAIFAQTTAFSYQGRLTDSAAPANGVYDLEFKFYDAGGTQIGATQVKEDVSVSNGTFTTELDFGAEAFNGSPRKLEISVRRGAESGAFMTLTPRQPITSTPYAIRALNATNVDNATSAATNAATAADFSGSLSGDVTGTQSATVVANVGGETAAKVASGAQSANAATSLNAVNQIVRRDATGGFAAGTVTLVRMLVTSARALPYRTTQARR